MALKQSNTYYARIANVVSGSETTVPTTWTTVLGSDDLTSITSDASTDSPSVTTVDKKVLYGAPVVTESWSFEGVARDDADQVDSLRTKARAKTLVWVEVFETLTTENTPANPDAGLRFQGYIGDLSESFPATDAVTFSFSINANEENVNVTSFVVSA